MIPALSKAVRLGPSEWLGLGVAYVYLLAAGGRIFLLKKNLNRWGNDYGADDSFGGLTKEQQDYLERRVRWVDLASRHPFPWARCLQRSLAVCLWMERNEFRPILKIGVQKQGEVLVAHAWVEYGGEVINDNPRISQKYVVLGTAGENLSRVPWSKGERWV